MSYTPGQLIYVSDGEWANSPERYSYKWYLNGVVIPNQTDNFLVIPDEVNSEIAAGVIAINDVGESVEVLSPAITIESPYIQPVSDLLNRMDVMPTYEVRELINETIVQLIADGLWDKIDVLYVVGNDEQQSLLNWKGDNFNGTPVGTVDFVSYRGFKGDGLTFYIDTHFDPSIEIPLGSNFQRNSLFFGASVQDTNGTGTINRFIMGLYAGNSNAAIDQAHSNSTTLSFKIGSAANGVVSGTTAVRPYHWYGSRTSSTDIRLYRDGSSVFSANNFSSQPWIENGGSIITHGRRRSDLGNTVDRLSPIRMSMHVLAAGLTQDEQADFFYTMNNYLAAVGAEEKQFRPVANAVVSISPINLEQNDEVTYTINIQSGDPTGTMDIIVDGDLTDDDFDESFVSALGNSASSTTGVSFDGVKTLTFSSNFVGPLVWKRTLTSSKDVGDSHKVRLENSSLVRLWGSSTAAVYGEPEAVTHGRIFGWNNSGFEFSVSIPPSDWTFSFATERGFNCFRIPYNISRIQPTNRGPITGSYSQTYKNKVNLALSLDSYVILDPHDYGGRGDDKIGSDNFTVEDFIDHLIKMVDFIGPHPNIILCLMNEPVGIPQKLWWSAAQSAVLALRAHGFYNDIQVPGTGYTGAHSWVSNGNASYAMNLTDSLNNHSFDVHQYFNTDNSGFNGVCVTNSQTRLNEVTTWATTNNKKLFLGEFAAGDPAISGQEFCGTVLPAALQILADNACWVGGTGWGFGDAWASGYPFKAIQNPLSNPDTWYMSTMIDAIDDIL